MNAVMELLEKFWVTKTGDRDTYYQIMHEMEMVRRFAQDYTGWNVIANEKLIKLEKVPDRAAGFMGITEFSQISDYVYLCSLLIFLEDLGDGEAFLLSEYIDHIDMILSEDARPDWTLFAQRKSLIRTMKYAESIELIISHEGDLSGVEDDIRHEVLYENTGYSRYYSVNFPVDVSEYRGYMDFEKRDESSETDRGHYRINRVYQNLSLMPVVYWEDASDADSLYLKNQRGAISKNLMENLGARLDVHNGAAFMMLDEDNIFGDYFPRDNTLSDIILLICGRIRSEYPNGDEVIDSEAFYKIVSFVASEYKNAWSKEYRDMGIDRLVAIVIGEMEKYSMVKRASEGIVLLQGAYKLVGAYPVDFDPKNAGEWEKKKSSKKELHSGGYRQVSLFD